VNRQRIKEQRLLILFLLGIFFFNFPALSVLNKNHLLAGIPVLYLYIFIVWIILVGVTAWIVERYR